MSTATAETSQTRGSIRTERSAKRIRAYLGGEVVADTTRQVLVWEVPYYPTYYFPAADVRSELIEPDGGVDDSSGIGEGQRFTVRAGGKEAPGAATRYDDPPIEELGDLIRLDWNAMDAWFEEDEEVFVHPRDPYTRVDILRSSRSVRIEVAGVVVADTIRPTFLFETGLPRRTYIPKPDVRMDLLEPTPSATMCPYKGTARYWSVRVGGEV